MESEEYYFLSKNSKQRRFEGCSRRKGRTIRALELSRRDKHQQELVMKAIKTTKDWDAEKINEYCRNVLEDGGMATDHRYFGIYSSVSMKKQKRWELSNRIRAAAYQQADNSEGPNICIVERYSAPELSRGARFREYATRATYVATADTNAASAGGKTKKKKRTPEHKRIIADRKPNSKYSTAFDLTEHPTVRRGSSDERPEISYEFHYACPRNRFPADCTKSSPWRKAGPSKCATKWYIEELKAYKGCEALELDKWLDDESNEQATEIEDEFHPTYRADLSLDLAAYLSSATLSSKAKKNHKSPRQNRKAQTIADATNDLDEEWVFVNDFEEKGQST